MESRFADCILEAISELYNNTVHHNSHPCLVQVKANRAESYGRRTRGGWTRSHDIKAEVVTCS